MARKGLIPLRKRPPVGQLRQVCRNVVTVMPLRQVPMGAT
jgi:hypothetical protein